jgi:hypothetical protein
MIIIVLLNLVGCATINKIGSIEYESDVNDLISKAWRLIEKETGFKYVMVHQDESFQTMAIVEEAADRLDFDQKKRLAAYSVYLPNHPDYYTVICITWYSGNNDSLRYSYTSMLFKKTDNKIE